MQSAFKTTVENGVIVFTVHINRWSANKKLRIQHTKASEDELPPADLASLGVRKVFDPKALAPFEAIRKETERLCFTEGTRFFGGVAIPKSEADEFAKKLKALQARFNAEKAILESNYQKTLDDWTAAHTGWEQTLEGALEVSEAMSRFNFGFHAVEIVMAGTKATEAKTELEQNIVSSKSAFIGQVYTEIAQMANAYRKDSLLGKDKATTRGLSSLQAMRKKLNGLSFLDSRIRPLVEMIDKVMDELPATGSIDGQQFATLLGVTSILSDQDMMQQYGEQVASGRDANSLFKSMTVAKQPAQAKQEVQATPVAPAAVKPGIPTFSQPKVPSIPQVGFTPPPAGGWGHIPNRMSVAA